MQKKPGFSGPLLRLFFACQEFRRNVSDDAVDFNPAPVLAFLQHGHLGAAAVGVDDRAVAVGFFPEVHTGALFDIHGRAGGGRLLILTGFGGST